MKKLLFAFFIFSFSLSEGQSWDWGSEAVPRNNNAWGDLLEDHPVAVDRLGNAYMTGLFYDTLYFGSNMLTALSGRENVFLIKYSTSGNVVWAKQGILANSICKASGYSVASDKNENSYFVGSFYDTITFGSHTLISAYASNAFVVKYDINGNVIWAKQSNSPSKTDHYVTATSICVDKSMNIYVAGTFFDTVLFSQDTLIVAGGTTGAFVVKYDSNGNLIWARQGVAGNVTDISMAAGSGNNIYIAAGFDNTFKFDTTILSGSGYNCFLIKLNSTGNVQWARQTNKPSDASGIASSIAIDGGENIYMTGYFIDTLSFGTDSLVDNGAGYDVFLAKYNSSGNVIWAKSGNKLGNNAWVGFSVACDTLSPGGGYFIFSGGSTNNAVAFGEDTFKLNSSYTTATVILQFDSSGKTLCGTIFTEGNEDDGDGIGADPSGKYIYLGGDLYDPAIFDTNMLVYGHDMPFIARWQPCSDTNITTLVAPISNKPSISLFPNPSSGIFTLSLSDPASYLDEKCNVEIYNVLGERIYSATPSLLPQSGGGASVSYAINLSPKPNGIYLYRVLKDDGSLVGSGKVVIAK